MNSVLTIRIVFRKSILHYLYIAFLTEPQTPKNNWCTFFLEHVVVYVVESLESDQAWKNMVCLFSKTFFLQNDRIDFLHKGLNQ